MFYFLITIMNHWVVLVNHDLKKYFLKFLSHPCCFRWLTSRELCPLSRYFCLLNSMISWKRFQIVGSSCNLQLNPSLPYASTTTQEALTLRFWGPTYFHRVYVKIDFESMAHLWFVTTLRFLMGNCELIPLGYIRVVRWTQASFINLGFWKFRWWFLNCSIQLPYLGY